MKKFFNHGEIMKHRSFLSRVRKILPDLHPAELKLGKLVCDFPGELASYSASELANLAGVSNATVTRFVRRLGYANYEEARVHARLEKYDGSRLYLGEVKAEIHQSTTTYAKSDMRNVQFTLDSVDESEIHKLAQSLLAARKVSVIGFRASAPLAQYLQWQLFQIIENIVAIPGSGQTMGEHLASIQSDDIVILFGLRRRIAQFDDIRSSITKSHAKLVLITDESMSIDQDAHWHFRCTTESPGPLFSHVGVMALINLISNITISAAEKDGRKRLMLIESANDFLGEL